jgi:RNA recognition motif-containing protein
MCDIIGQREKLNTRGYKIMQGSKLYVGNLDYSVTEQLLEELFANYGEVKQVNIIEGRGFGFVEMADPEGAESAKNALNDAVFQGRALKVDEARAPKRRERDSGGYGGSRRGGSRSGYGSSRGGGGRNQRRGY